MHQLFLFTLSMFNIVDMCWVFTLTFPTAYLPGFLCQIVSVHWIRWGATMGHWLVLRRSLAHLVATCCYKVVLCVEFYPGMVISDDHV